MNVSNFLSKPIAKMTINDFTSVAEHVLKKDKDFAMEMVEHGLGEEISPQFMKSSNEVADYFMPSGVLKPERKEELLSLLQKTKSPKDATIGDVLNRIERAEVERKYNYLA